MRKNSVCPYSHDMPNAVKFRHGIVDATSRRRRMAYLFNGYRSFRLAGSKSLLLKKTSVDCRCLPGSSPLRSVGSKGLYLEMGRCGLASAIA